MSSISGQKAVLSAFDGAIVVRRVEDPALAFYYEVCFDLTHPRLIKLASEEKPPMHFHPHQEEYIKVLSGRLGVQVEKTEYKLGPQDGELRVLPWTNHRLYPLPPSESAGGHDEGKTVFLLSAEKSSLDFQLDDIFFQNWYGYQDEVVMTGGKFDVIQVMNMFDAGGSYLTFPTWIPFSRRLAQLVGIVIGRWLGGLLGYQPFHRKWTDDWPQAAEKMRASIFLRRFANQAKED